MKTKKALILLLLPICLLTSCNKVSQETAESLLSQMINPREKGEYLYWTANISGKANLEDGSTIKDSMICDRARDGSFRYQYHRETINAQKEKEIVDVDYIVIASYQDYGKVNYASCDKNGEREAASYIGDLYERGDPTPFIYWSSYTWPIFDVVYEEYFTKLDFYETTYDEMDNHHIVYKNSFSSKKDGNLSVTIDYFSYYGKSRKDYDCKGVYTYKYDGYYLRSVSGHQYYRYDIIDKSSPIYESNYKATLKYYKEFTFELPSNWKDYLVE